MPNYDINKFTNVFQDKINMIQGIMDISLHVHALQPWISALLHIPTNNPFFGKNSGQRHHNLEWINKTYIVFNKYSEENLYSWCIMLQNF